MHHAGRPCGGVTTSRSAGPAKGSVSMPRRCGANARQTPPEVREAMKKIASTRHRFGYRRVGVLLERLPPRTSRG